MIMGLVLIEVALWQWRVAVTGRNQFLRGALLGGVGAIIQITVVIRLVGDVGSAASIAGYAAGVALGVAAGGFLDRRATPQMVKVQVIAPSRHGLPEGLRVKGWPTTRFVAHGHDEELDVVNIAVEETPPARVGGGRRRARPGRRLDHRAHRPRTWIGNAGRGMKSLATRTRPQWPRESKCRLLPDRVGG